MQLSEFLTADDKSATALAKAVSVSVSTITRLAKGERRPSFDLAERIAVATGGLVLPGDFARQVAKAEAA